mgnify:CR=1 FL=1
MSPHLGFNDGALDAFDTVFCAGQHVVDVVLGVGSYRNFIVFAVKPVDNTVDAGVEYVVFLPGAPRCL